VNAIGCPRLWPHLSKQTIGYREPTVSRRPGKRMNVYVLYKLYTSTTFPRCFG
jgi:hypothetical protein